MSIKSLRKIVRSARKGLCQTCSKTEYPQLEAAGAGHVGCLMYTVETQGLRVRDQNQVSAVHVAARKNQMDVLIYLVENGLISDLIRAKNGATPAHDAAGTGNLECLRYLLIHTGATAHDKDFSGQTPLHWAAMFGHLRVAIWLVNDCNSTINLANKQGLTPIHLAAQKSHIDVLQWLVRITYKKFPNPLEVVNQRTSQGCTPLFLAASEGHIHIVRWLSEKAGGDPTIFSFAGVAPLHAATALGHSESMQFLFQFGLGTSPGGLRTRDGSSAIHMAARCGHIEIVKWLLSQKEISGNEKDHTHYTASHEAAEHGQFRILKFLYDHNINVEAVDINGYAPLDIAVKNKHRHCENFLKSVSQPNLNGKVRRPVARKGSTGNSHLEDYGVARMDDMNMQLTMDMEQSLHHRKAEAFPTLRDMMGEDGIKHMRQPSDEGDLEQLKKEHEAERKRKDMAAKLQQEQKERNRLMAKKMIEQKKAQEVIREQILKDNPGSPPQAEEVEQYITKTHPKEKQKPGLVEERKNAFEGEGQSESTIPKKKGFLSRLRKTVTPPIKDTSHDHHVLHTKGKPQEKKQAISQTVLKESTVSPFENDGSSTSLVSSKSGSSSKSGKKLKRLGYVDSITWTESGEAVRAGMLMIDSPSGKRRRPKVRKLTPAPVPIKNRLAKKDVAVPKLDLEAGTKSSKTANKAQDKVPNPKDLSKALASSSGPPKYTRQTSQDDSSPPPSPTLADIEDELSKMEDTTLALQNPPKVLGRVLVPSFVSKYLSEEEHNVSEESEEDSEEEESEEESSEADSDSTASSDSSDRRRLMMKQQLPAGGLKSGLLRSGLLGPKSGGGRTGGSPRKLLSGGFSQMARRRIIRLTTIYEDQEEEDRQDVQKLVDETDEERAERYYRDILVQKTYNGWQRYMFMMKAAQTKASAMYRQRRRALLSRHFNEWLNYTVMERFKQFSGEAASQTKLVESKSATKVHVPPKTATPSNQQPKAATAREMSKALTTTPSAVHEVRARKVNETPRPAKPIASEPDLSPKPAEVAESTPLPSTAKDEYNKEEEVSFKSLGAIMKQFPKSKSSPEQEAGRPRTSSFGASTAPDITTLTPITPSVPLSSVSTSSVDFDTASTSSLKSYQRKTSFRMTHREKSSMYLEWLNDHLEALDLPSASNLTTDVSSAVPVLTVLTNLSGRKMPQYYKNPRLLPQLMNNWKLVRDEMEYLGMKTMGIEPEDLSKQNEAVIHLMFNVILKWYNSR